MREVDWKDCLAKNIAKKGSPDEERAAALAETARDRRALITAINEKNCNFVFEDYYTSLLELLQATAFRRGYNILNHLCLGFYLRDELGRDDLHTLFDDVRYKRNSLTYYGSKMEFATAQQAIKTCKRLIKELEKI